MFTGMFLNPGADFNPTRFFNSTQHGLNPRLSKMLIPDLGIPDVDQEIFRDREAGGGGKKERVKLQRQKFQRTF